LSNDTLQIATECRKCHGQAITAWSADGSRARLTNMVNRMVVGGFADRVCANVDVTFRIRMAVEQATRAGST
jgi:hypothetical protein